MEGEIGRFRRRHLTPVPNAESPAALNEAMAAANTLDDARRIAARVETVGQAAARELGVLRPLPAGVFDVTAPLSCRVDVKARICVHQSYYSVPTRLAGRRVEARLGATTAGATALAGARASGAFTAGHQRFWDAARHVLGDGPGTRALIGALLLHRPMPAHAVLAGMAAALESGRHDPDLVAVEARRHLTGPTAASAVALPAAVSAALPPAARTDTDRPAPSLLSYDELLPGQATA